MHDSVLQFGATHLPSDLRGRRVLDVGSLDVNGSLRYLTVSRDCRSYVGVDMRPGRGVDVVARAEALPFRQPFDLVICTEMLEHAYEWQRALDGVQNKVCVGGNLLLTTRSPGFPLHDFPSDYWRFTPEILATALSGFTLNVCVNDPQPGHPGVLIWATRAIDLLPPVRVEAIPS